MRWCSAGCLLKEGRSKPILYAQRLRMSGVGDLFRDVSGNNNNNIGNTTYMEDGIEESVRQLKW